jgi:hypothetical protein
MDRLNQRLKPLSTMRMQTGRWFAGERLKVEGGLISRRFFKGVYINLFNLYTKHTQNRTNSEKNKVEKFSTFLQLFQPLAGVLSGYSPVS